MLKTMKMQVGGILGIVPPLQEVSKGGLVVFIAPIFIAPMCIECSHAAAFRGKIELVGQGEGQVIAGFRPQRRSLDRAAAGGCSCSNRGVYPSESRPLFKANATLSEVSFL